MRIEACTDRFSATSLSSHCRFIVGVRPGSCPDKLPRFSGCVTDIAGQRVFCSVRNACRIPVKSKQGSDFMLGMQFICTFVCG